MHFIQTEVKLLLTWLGTGVIVLVNKTGLFFSEYEIWRTYIIDILTILSLIVAIGYTFTRWLRLIREKKSDKDKE